MHGKPNRTTTSSAQAIRLTLCEHLILSQIETQSDSVAMAFAAGIPERSAWRAIRGLEAKSVVSITRRKGRGFVNRYTLVAKVSKRPCTVHVEMEGRS